MRRRAVSTRDALIRHPWAIGLMDSRSNPGLATLRHHDAVIGCLRSGGFTIAGAAHAFSVLDSYVYGFTLQEISLPFESSVGIEDLADSILEQMPRDEFPHLTEMIGHHALKPGYAYAAEFDIGLDLILDGLERQREIWVRPVTGCVHALRPHSCRSANHSSTRCPACSSTGRSPECGAQSATGWN
ncbi:hypothetical protein QFZ82_007401 [Streptomyces sp. V4I23]|uniref:TetR/AcrR family transcriptional regulator C-terminal domain-containing protein n=1 Tax=Streptomyces sp. V4I23 TaxID=3042282 RepID=UPI0027876607|nr:TetR/AcrR family transcriptional regulator C-terminal domain-containing protein [Streptomyces sp. V4I23]MDQ1012916.1 hypothetical protein [Streptomyces sp. V4I23]